jgi:hypothetical protein
MYETMDDLAGFTAGYCSKLPALPPIKNLGITSLGPESCD